MFSLILFLLMAVPEQGGKVVLNTGTPGAEFYLDANFVAVTDENGTLTMENFPAGSFSFSVVKRGYKTYKGSFAIREGEAKLLSPVMERIRETREPIEKASESSGGSAPFDSRSKINLNAKSPVVEARTPQVKNSSPRTPAVDQTAGEVSSEESEVPSHLFVFIVLFVIASFGVGMWIWRRRRIVAQIPPLDTASDMEAPQPPTDASNRPDPEFIEELRRREELLNAGFVGTSPRVVDKESMKEKEVVIVLPKEAFRYDEDK